MSWGSQKQQGEISNQYEKAVVRNPGEQKALTTLPQICGNRYNTDRHYNHTVGNMENNQLPDWQQHLRPDDGNE